MWVSILDDLMTKNINKKETTYNISDLIDRLSIDQNKQYQFENSSKKYEESIQKNMKSIDIILKKKKIRLNEKNISILLSLSQVNLYIWFLREKISKQAKPDSKNIKLSHQINAVRNQLKNKLLQNLIKKKKFTNNKTNTNLEDLKDWELTALND